MHNRRWVGDDLHNLLYRLPKELRIIYPDHNWESLRSKRKLFRRKIKNGEIMPPSRSEKYPGPEEERGKAQARREALAKPVGQKALSEMISLESRKKLHDQLDSAIDQYNLPPEHIEALRIKKISAWEQGIKNSDGEFESHPLYGIQLDADPVKFEPSWPVVTRVESGKKLTRKENHVEKPFKTCMVFPDMQTPFHDEQALDIALQVMADVKPDQIVFLGDILDLSAWGRFEQQPEWATATQGAINTVHQLLATIRKTLPKAEIKVLAGNHEERMPKSLLKNAQAAYGLKRADALDGWPVMSVPYLCAFDQLDVEYIPGYPANRLWLNPNLQIRHGTQTAKSGGSSRRTSAMEKVSTIFGHDHRLSSHADTIDTHDGGQTIFSYGAGTLSRIDGHVPSYYSGRDLDGHPVRNIENWQHGFLLAHYDESNFHIEPVPINTFNGYQTMYRGRLYEPN